MLRIPHMFRCFFGIDLSQDVNQSHEHALVSEKKYKSGFSIAAYCVYAVFSASCSGDAVINIVLFSFVIITISVYTEKRITRHRAIARRSSSFCSTSPRHLPTHHFCCCFCFLFQSELVTGRGGAYGSERLRLSLLRLS